MSVISNYTFEEAKADRSYWGRLVESTVGAHIHNTGMPEVKLHYRRENNIEVDFILKRGPKLAAIEVKSGKIRSAASGLEQFAGRFDPSVSLIVGRGGVDLSEFLTIPAKEWLDSQ